jgi:hypothetical protein
VCDASAPLVSEYSQWLESSKEPDLVRPGAI